jgi:hypothetical protein
MSTRKLLPIDGWWTGGRPLRRVLVFFPDICAEAEIQAE